MPVPCSRSKALTRGGGSALLLTLAFVSAAWSPCVWRECGPPVTLFWCVHGPHLHHSPPRRPPWSSDTAHHAAVLLSAESHTAPSRAGRTPSPGRFLPMGLTPHRCPLPAFATVSCFLAETRMKTIRTVTCAVFGCDVPFSYGDHLVLPSLLLEPVTLAPECVRGVPISADEQAGVAAAGRAGLGQ